MKNIIKKIFDTIWDESSITNISIFINDDQIYTGDKYSIPWIFEKKVSDYNRISVTVVGAHVHVNLYN